MADHKAPPCTARAHHWTVAPPDGRELLPATCRHCGVTWAFAAAEDPDMQTAIGLTVNATRTTPEDVRMRFAAQRARRRVQCEDCGREFRPMNLPRHRQAQHAEAVA